MIDPNIPETGEQLVKSNSGPDTCCYEYCDQFTVYKGLCARCDSTEIESSKVPALEQNQAETMSTTTMTTTAIKRRYDDYTIAKLNPPPQSCQLVPGLSLTTSRCEIPYYASSLANAITTSTSTTTTTTTVATSVAASSCYNVTSIQNKRLYFIWTISWCLLLTLLITNNYIAAWANHIQIQF